MKAAVMGVVQAHFRPEFINRLDEIVVFRPLDKAQIRTIARIQTDYLGKRLAERQLRWSVRQGAGPAGHVGFDPVYGARPLKRAIQQQIGKSAGAEDPGRRIRPREIPSGSMPKAGACCSARGEQAGRRIRLRRHAVILRLSCHFLASFPVSHRTMPQDMEFWRILNADLRIRVRGLRQAF